MAVRTPARRIIVVSAAWALGGMGGAAPADACCVRARPPLSHVWLARHQHADGSWGDPQGPAAERERVTGLAVLTFLGAGYTHLSRDTWDGFCFGTTVRRGLRYLLDLPDTAGAGRETPVAAGARLWAALALTEAYGRTGALWLKEAALRELAWLETTRRNDAGWGDGDRPDAERTAMAVLVLVSARAGSLPLSPALAGAADRGLAAVATHDHDAPLSPEATAVVAAATALWTGIPGDAADGRWTGRILEGRDATGQVSPHLAYWGSAALMRTDGCKGERYQAWGETAIPALLRSMRPAHDGDLAGSWDPPPDPPAPPLGRLEDANPETQARVRQLVEALGDDRWAGRERAMRELCAVGMPAAPFLDEALSCPDAEVRTRCGLLLKRLGIGPNDNPRVETTCLHQLALQIHYRYENVFGGDRHPAPRPPAAADAP